MAGHWPEESRCERAILLPETHRNAVRAPRFLRMSRCSPSPPSDRPGPGRNLACFVTKTVLVPRGISFMARYPRIQVSLRSRNPLAVVAAVREEMRLAEVEPELIRRFSDEALSQRSRSQILEVCRDWVDVSSG